MKNCINANCENQILAVAEDAKRMEASELKPTMARVFIRPFVVASDNAKKLGFLNGTDLADMIGLTSFNCSHHERHQSCTMVVCCSDYLFAKLYNSIEKKFENVDYIPFSVGYTLKDAFKKFVFFDFNDDPIPEDTILTPHFANRFTRTTPLCLYERKIYARFFDNDVKKIGPSSAYSFEIDQTLDSLFGPEIFFEFGRVALSGTFSLDFKSVMRFSLDHPLTVFYNDDEVVLELIKRQEGFEDEVVIVPVAARELKQDNFSLTPPFVLNLAKRWFKASRKFRWHLDFQTTTLPKHLVNLSRESIFIKFEESGSLVMDRVTGEKLNELKTFINTAALVNDDHYFTGIRNLVSTIRVLASHPFSVYSNNTPFISILAPSGTGKTQLAFSLNQNGCPSIHLLSLEPKQLDMQTIYSALQSISLSFHQQISRDLLILSELKDGLISGAAEDDFMNGDLVNLVSTCRFIVPFKETKLYTVGFLHFILKKRREHLSNPNGKIWEDYLFGDPTEADIPAMSPSEFATFWMPFRENMPCIILDEFGLTNKNRTRLLYARNLIRALSLVCITMGTDSKASNLIDPSAVGTEHSSKNSVPNQPWVYVVHRLPRIKVSAVPGFQEYKKTSMEYLESLSEDGEKANVGERWKVFFQWIENDLKTCFPRFLRFGFGGLCDYIKDKRITVKTIPDAFQVMLTTIWKQFYATKYSARQTDWPIFGQVAHLLYQSWNTLPVRLVDQYQAHLLPPSKWDDPKFVEDNALLESDVFIPSPFNLKTATYNDFYRTNWCFPLERKLERTLLTLFTEDGSFWTMCRAYNKSTELDNLASLAFLTNAGENSGFFIDGDTTLFKAYFKIYLFNRQICRANPNPLACDTEKGYNLESFAQLAIILASSKGKDKFYGTPFPEACLEIARNMSKKDRASRIEISVLDPNCGLKCYFDSHATGLPRLPLLGPMNSSYDFLKKFLPKANLGSIRYCKNFEEIDGAVTFLVEAPNGQLWLIALEMKNYTTRKLTNSGLGSISTKSEKYCPTDGAADISYNRIVIIFSMEASYNPKPIAKTKDEEGTTKKRTNPSNQTTPNRFIDSKRAKQVKTSNKSAVQTDEATEKLTITASKEIIKNQSSHSPQDDQIDELTSNSNVKNTRWNLRSDQILFLSKSVENKKLRFEKFLAPDLSEDPDLQSVKTIFIVYSLKDVFGPDYSIDHRDHASGYRLYNDDENIECDITSPFEASKQ